MNKRIKLLAEQAEKYADENFKGEPTYFDAYDSKFAELVRADEREACAKVCETLGVHPALNVYAGGPDWYKHGKECAAAIRARSET